jgi:hypothetical protein
MSAVPEAGFDLCGGLFSVELAKELLDVLDLERATIQRVLPNTIGSTVFHSGVIIM